MDLRYRSVALCVLQRHKCVGKVRNVVLLERVHEHRHGCWLVMMQDRFQAEWVGRLFTLAVLVEFPRSLLG